MMAKKLFFIAALSLCTLALAVPSEAQHQRGGSGSGRGSGGAVARPGGGARPPGGGGHGGYYGSGYYRPYYGGYRGYYGYPSWSFGFYYGGYPYYSPYYYPWGYYGGPYWGAGWGYPYPYGNSDAVRGLGGVQIKGAPKDAQVYADGYYAGTVEDFDGAFQHLDLEAGAHHIEIREEGRPAVSFDVNVVPGETVTYHAK